MKLHTRIQIEECQARLTSNVDVERLAFTWSGYAGSKPILGTFRGERFRLRKRRYYRNSFGPLFFGQLAASPKGTFLEGQFKMHPLARGFMVVWFSFLGLGFFTGLLSLIMGREVVQGSSPLSMLFTLGMAAFGFVLVKFSRWLGSNEEKAIVAFLKKTLEADDVT